MRNPNGVDSVCRHSREIVVDFREVVIFLSLGVLIKRPVGHAANVKLLLADEEKFPVCPRPDRAFGSLQRRSVLDDQRSNLLRVQNLISSETCKRRGADAATGLPKKGDVRMPEKAV